MSIQSYFVLLQKGLWKLCSKAPNKYYWMPTPSGWLYLPLGDSYRMWDTVLGNYERAKTKLIKKLLRPGHIFFDVGANLGYYSVLAGYLVGEDGKVLAIEADPTITHTLRKTIHRNNLSNIIIEHVAVSDSTALHNFYIGKHTGWGSLIAYEQKVAESFESIPIQATTIDRIVEERAFTRLDLVKIDIEGAEMLALKGAEKTLRQLTPNLLIDVDFFEAGRFQELLDWLFRNCYKAYYTSPPYLEIVEAHGIKDIFACPSWRVPADALNSCSK